MRRRVERREAEKRERAERAGAGGGEAHFSADGEHGQGEPPGVSWMRCARSAAGRKWR